MRQSYHSGVSIRLPGTVEGFVYYSPVVFVRACNLVLSSCSLYIEVDRILLLSNPNLACRISYNYCTRRWLLLNLARRISYMENDTRANYSFDGCNIKSWLLVSPLYRKRNTHDSTQPLDKKITKPKMCRVSQPDVHEYKAPSLIETTSPLTHDGWSTTQRLINYSLAWSVPRPSQLQYLLLRSTLYSIVYLSVPRGLEMGKSVSKVEGRESSRRTRGMKRGLSLSFIVEKEGRECYV